MPEDTLRGQNTEAADTIEEESALFLAKEEVKCSIIFHVFVHFKNSYLP